ncbi:MAG: HlyC/CorC family transporter [Bacteriovoracaceae bacterium]|nr:HlyC/CorC family transporter [Bacteriovoracaceae bacterium]
MIETYELVVLFFCFAGSGFFSGSEAVLMSIAPDRVRQLIDEGGRTARAMTFMAEKPNEILTTILVGNNIVNIGAASLVTTITGRIFQNDVVAISTGLTTFVILIFGEVIPKTFARVHAEKLSLLVISVLRLAYYLLYFLIQPTTWFIERVLGRSAQIHGRIVTRDDIEFMISKAEKEKTMDSKQLELLNSILEFPTIKVKDIMILRKEVKFVQRKSSFQEIIKMARSDIHSRYPVCDGDLEHVYGFLHIKDLALLTKGERENFDVKDYLKSSFFVYEHMRIQAVFDHMNSKKVHLALVKDETGLVVGIITLEDIIEEIFGEIQDEHDFEEKEVIEHYQQQDMEEGILVDGQISLRDLYNEYDIKIPLNDNFSTLAGFILDMLGNNFPEEDQIIIWEGFSFDVEKVENYEIKKIRIKDVDGDKHLFSKKDAEEADEYLDNKDEDDPKKNGSGE